MNVDRSEEARTRPIFFLTSNDEKVRQGAILEILGRNPAFVAFIPGVSSSPLTTAFERRVAKHLPLSEFHRRESSKQIAASAYADGHAIGLETLAVNEAVMGTDGRVGLTGWPGELALPLVRAGYDVRVIYVERDDLAPQRALREHYWVTCEAQRVQAVALAVDDVLECICRELHPELAFPLEIELGCR
ncbi:hypothetical protein EPO34_02220 [Patescibacteria group bacterium]|nr:MAG: hypothetical protein EPO34_02220 [Patescibacteria group bacterium]